MYVYHLPNKEILLKPNTNVGTVNEWMNQWMNAFSVMVFNYHTV